MEPSSTKPKSARKTIQHGDRIRIGNSEFVFLTGPEDDATLLTSRARNQTVSAEWKTMSLDRSGLPTDDSWVGRMARDLTAFFKIADVINSIRNAQELQGELLALICEVIPATQAAIVLQPDANEGPGPLCAWNRSGVAAQEMLIRDGVGAAGDLGTMCRRHSGFH